MWGRENGKLPHRSGHHGPGPWLPRSDKLRRKSKLTSACLETRDGTDRVDHHLVGTTCRQVELRDGRRHVVRKVLPIGEGHERRSGFHALPKRSEAAAGFRQEKQGRVIISRSSRIKRRRTVSLKVGGFEWLAGLRRRNLHSAVLRRRRAGIYGYMTPIKKTRHSGKPTTTLPTRDTMPLIFTSDMRRRASSRWDPRQPVVFDTA
jgi:hypothetical protein